MDICDWLRAFLADGPHEVAEVRNAAREAGFTRGELRNAKRACGVVTTNNSAPGKRASEWY